MGGTRYLVLGGAGFLGANLVRRLLEEPGADVAVVDSLEERLRASMAGLAAVEDRILFRRADITDATAMRSAVAGRDVIFNCAAQSSHPLSLHDPLYDARINCLGNLTLLEAVREANRGAVVVYVSSSTIVGKAVNDVIDEDHAEKPLDIYSANKGVAEKYYRVYHRVHDLKTVAVRFANIYGPFGKGYPEFGFINYFIHLAQSGRPVEVYGSGEQTRNVLFAGDACEALLAAARTPALFGEAWFATGDEHLTVREIAQAVAEVFGQGEVREIPWPEERKRIEIEKVRFSSERFRKKTGWRPTTAFREGLERTRRIVGNAG